MNKNILIWAGFFIVLLMGVGNVSASSITLNPNSASGSYSYPSNIFINATINGTSISSLNYTFNGNTLRLFDGLVAWYPFSNISDNPNTLYEWSGKGNTLTNNNVAIYDSNGYYNFTGTPQNSSLTMIFPSVFNLTMNYTLSGWAYSNQNQSANTMFIWLNPTDSANPSFGIFHAGGKVSCGGFVNYLNGTNVSQLTTANTVIANGVWTYLACTLTWINSTTINITQYVNGIATQSIWNNNISKITYNVSGLIIGRQKTGFARYFNGSIDDVELLNRSLSDSEVASKYLIGRQGFIPLTNSSFNLAYNTTLLTPSNYLYNFSVTDNISTASSNNNFSIYSLVNLNISSVTLGSVNPYFWGNNNHGLWIGTPSWIDANNDDAIDSLSNVTWHREKWLEAGLMTQRVDLSLNYVAKNETSFGCAYANCTNLLDINAKANGIAWACQNGIRSLVIVSYMPSWLANTTDCSSNNKTCMPSNFTTWGNLVVNAINNITYNGLYASCVDIEVWNEPDLTQFFLSDIAKNNSNRSVRYNQLYNVTQIAIKTAFPTMKVGGPALASFVSINEGNAMMRGWLGNFSSTNQYDFISFHGYRGSGYPIQFADADLLTAFLLSNMTSLCTQYGGNCSNMYMTEFNDLNGTNNVNDTIQSKQMALYYQGFLNLNPNGRMNIFDWQSQYFTGAIDGFYPYNFRSVAEPQLENRLYAQYNVTKLFANAFGSGAVIRNYTVDDSNVSVVVGNYLGKRTIVLINKDSFQKNVSINLESGRNINTLTDLVDGSTYSGSGTSFSNILIDANEVLYLQGCDSWINGTSINFLNDSAQYCEGNITITHNTSIVVSVSSPINISFINMLSWSPYNDIKNLSNGVILASTINNYSLILSAGQQVEVGDFNNLTSFSFVSPSSVAGSFARDWVSVNVSVVGSGFSNLTIYLYNSTGLVMSNFSTSNLTFKNFTNLPDGNYSFNVTAYDTAGVAYYSSSVNNIVLDTVVPVLSVFSPVNLTYSVAIISINFSAADASSLWYFNGVSNVSFSSVNSIVLEDGVYNYTFFANDSAGNVASSNVVFVVSAFVAPTQSVGGGGSGGVLCSSPRVLVNGLCVNQSTSVSSGVWVVKFSRDRFIFSRGVVDFVVLFSLDNVSVNPKGLVASVSLPYGLVNIPLSNLGAGQFGFSYDFSRVNVSSVDVLFSWDGGSRVLPLSFVDVPLFLVDNPVTYSSVTDDDGRLDSQSLLVLIILSILVVLALMIGLWKWVNK